MLTKAYKQTGLQRLLLYAVKSCFTYEELNMITNYGVTLRGLLEFDVWNAASRGDCQKGALTLMCRWPFDDINDLWIALFRQNLEILVTRESLGASNSDSVIEAVAGSLQGIIDEIGGLAGRFTGAYPMKGIDRRTGELIDDVKGAMTNYLDPEWTFNDENVVSNFLTIMTRDKSGLWQNV